MTSYYAKEIRTDAVGEYVAYIYADGHTETEPPGRPLSREDVQRQRLTDFARRQAKRALQASQSAKTTGSPKQSIVRENRVTMAPRVLNENFAMTLSTLQVMAQTLQAPEDQRENLIRNADLGGDVVGDRAGARQEYSRPRPFIDGEQRTTEITYNLEG
jgi:hypothetical protein